MKKKNKICIYPLVLMGIFLMLTNSCKKETTNNNSSTTPLAIDDPLSDADAALLVSLHDTLFSLNNIYLDNGQSVYDFAMQYNPGFLQLYPSLKSIQDVKLRGAQQKEFFIDNMIIIGNWLMTRTEHNFPAGGPNEPAQTGLGYSSGSKDFRLRQIPPNPYCDCRDISIYGLDCSGMIYIMTTYSNLPAIVPKGQFCVDSINYTSKWNKAFRSSDDYKNLIMVDEGKLPLNQIQTGDIIIWPGKHIGMAVNNWIFQSNGDTHSPFCKNNTDLGHGPRTLPMDQVNKINNGNYKVFRVDTIKNSIYIGESYQGGIVGYILLPGDPGYDPNVQHGIIAAPTDQSTGIQWYNGSYIPTGTSMDLGTGKANTNAIITTQGSGNYAAMLCHNLTLGGYSDWYLPSKDELNKLYLNQAVIGGFTYNFYWSSSEDDAYTAWYQYFYDGSQSYSNKSWTYYVRAIRAF